MYSKSYTAVMQPYLFPYIGYLNLVWASESFVFYDDVNFIKKGWINRNIVMMDGLKFPFSIPLVKPSQNKLIKDTLILDLESFKSKFVKQIYYAYKGSKYFETGMEYVESTLKEDFCSIAELAQYSVTNFFSMIRVEKVFYSSSISFPNIGGLNRSDRLIQITKQLGSNCYLNSIGGINLYSGEYFQSHNIALSFLMPKIRPYSQHKNLDFLPGLSLIDIIMNLCSDEIVEHLMSYEIIDIFN